MSPTTLVLNLLVLALAGQAAVSDPKKAEGTERLAFMNDSVKTYTITAVDSGEALRLTAEPVFRLGGQGNGLLDGAIFLWTDGVGRPAAAAQVMYEEGPDKPNGRWNHEFTSLATAPIAATGGGGRLVWQPRGPGVRFQPLPGAPKPAASPPARLRQMRALAAEFRVEDAPGRPARWTDLRLLTTPIARYGKAGGVPTDGALFAFVTGTDPEAFLFLEVRDGGGAPGWHYALAPMSCWALKAAHKGRSVWELPDRYGRTFDPGQPFFDRPYQP